MYELETSNGWGGNLEPEVQVVKVVVEVVVVEEPEVILAVFEVSNVAPVKIGGPPAVVDGGDPT